MQGAGASDGGSLGLSGAIRYAYQAGQSGRTSRASSAFRAMICSVGQGPRCLGQALSGLADNLRETGDSRFVCVNAFVVQRGPAA